MEKQHTGNERLRILQKALAEEITIRVHSKEDLEHAIKLSDVLFSKDAKEKLFQLNEKELEDIFDGLDTFKISKEKIQNGINILDALAVETNCFSSKGELKKLIQSNGFSVNMEKHTDINSNLSLENLIKDKYILLRKGKDKDSLVIVE